MDGTPCTFALLQLHINDCYPFLTLKMQRVLFYVFFANHMFVNWHNSLLQFDWLKQRIVSIYDALRSIFEKKGYDTVLIPYRTIREWYASGLYRIVPSFLTLDAPCVLPIDFAKLQVEAISIQQTRGWKSSRLAILHLQFCTIDDTSQRLFFFNPGKMQMCKSARGSIQNWRPLMKVYFIIIYVFPGTNYTIANFTKAILYDIKI